MHPLDIELFLVHVGLTTNRSRVLLSHWTVEYCVGLFTGQFADKPTRGQSSCGLVNSQTG